jgi:excisionase family DNA binding protein
MSDDVLSANERADLVADGLMSIRDVASFLGVGRSTAYELMNAGRLAYVKIGRSRRIPRRAVVNLAAEALQTGENEHT